MKIGFVLGRGFNISECRLCPEPEGSEDQSVKFHTPKWYQSTDDPYGHIYIRGCLKSEIRLFVDISLMQTFRYQKNINPPECGSSANPEGWALTHFEINSRNYFRCKSNINIKFADWPSRPSGSGQGPHSDIWDKYLLINKWNWSFTIVNRIFGNRIIGLSFGTARAPDGIIF